MLEQTKLGCVPSLLELPNSPGSALLAGRNPDTVSHAVMTTQTESSNQALTTFHSTASQLDRDLEVAKTQADLDKFQPVLEDLRRQLAEGVEWWVGYDIRQARETLQRVEKSFDTAASRVRPARKFRFRRVVEKPATPEKVETESRETPSGDIGIVYGDGDVKDGVLTCGDLSGQDVTIRGLSDVKVVVGNAGAVRFVGLTGCTVTTRCVDGSVWVGSCRRCKLQTRSRQLRIHDTVDTDFVVDVQSGPVIERCQKVRFGPLGEGRMWKDVKDFSWLREGKSPNWEVIDETGEGR